MLLAEHLVKEKNVFCTLRCNQESRSCYTHGASLWKWKAGVILTFLAAVILRSRSKQTIVSIWPTFHAKTSCCHRTNSKRKGWRFISDLVCGDNVSGSFGPAVLRIQDKVHWQIVWYTRLWLLQCLLKYLYVLCVTTFFHTSRRKTSVKG